MKSKEAVILIHGLYLNSLVMKNIEVDLENSGYKVYSYDYHTLNFDDIKDVEKLRNFIKNNITEHKLHYIGHSMGGLLIRLYLNKYYRDKKNGRVITLGTPHNTSNIAKKIKNSPFKVLIGSAGNYVLTEKIPDFPSVVEFGCIIGTQNIGLLNIISPEENEGDGVVSLKEAKIKSCKHYCYINTTHTGLLFNGKVNKNILYFLKNGFFLV